MNANSIGVYGDGVDHSGNYLLHFDQKDLRPVEAFWSVTVYDEHGFQTPTN
jgi:hypothetical protein